MTFALALAGLGLSATAHALTLWGVNPLQKFPLACLSLLALALALVWPLRRAWKAEEAGAAQTGGAPWTAAVFGVLSFYAIFTFFYVTLVLGEGGNAGQAGGKYLLTSHGRTIRELTPAEYQRHLTYLPRIASAWLAFYYFCCAVFLRRQLGRRAARVVR